MKMIKKIYTIYDSKAEVYLQPFYEKTDGSAIRAIQDNMKQDDSMLQVHKSDLTLFCIGEYDDNDGTIVGKTVKKNLGTLIDLDPNRES